MKNSNHIIEKVRVEVNTSRLETAHSIQNNIDVFLKNELFPRLELLFDEYKFQDEIVRLDELTLDLSVEKGHDFSNLPTEIYRQLKEKIDLQIPFQMELKSDFYEDSESEKQNVRRISGKQNSEFHDGKIPSDELTLNLLTEKGADFSGLETEKQNIRRISATQNSGNVLLFFLENGYLPWYGKEKHISSFTQPEIWEKNLDDQTFFWKLDQILKTDETAADRFILQFPDEIITAYLRRKKFRIHAESSEILKISQNLGTNGRRIFLKLLIRLAHDDFPGVSEIFDRLIFGVMMDEKSVSQKTEVPGTEQLKKLFQRILPESSLQDSVLEKIDLLIEGKPLIRNETQKHQETKPKPFLEKDEDEIWIQNAGLILLHPFLKPFFASCKITGKQGDLSPENFAMAVQTLHFLATGNEDVFETNLVFEKFLCGVPLKMPVQQKSLLTDSIKTDATALLVEVVRYWPALKNTSADGLRQMFIQRNGKLIQEEAKYKLIVERKAQDVLLEKLNWNISVIKLPWISKILFTEW